MTERKYPRFAQDFSGETLTQQHPADACDVNNIIATYDRTGIDPYADRRAKAVYGDGTYKNFFDVMRTVREAESAFSELPQAVQDRFGDVESYLAALEAQNHNEPAEGSEGPQDPENDSSQMPSDEGEKSDE